MFQAVFAWAQPLMELFVVRLHRVGSDVHDTLPAGLLQSFLQNGRHFRRRQRHSCSCRRSSSSSSSFCLGRFSLHGTRRVPEMDRIMGGAGLHGRAFIPLLSSFRLRHSGIMATRRYFN